MEYSILKLLAIYSSELVLWIALPLGSSVMFLVLTQHLVSRSVPSRFTAYVSMRKTLHSSLVWHSRWVAKASFTTFFLLFFLMWAAIHGAARYRLASQLVQAMIEKAGDLKPEGQEFSIEAPFDFSKDYQKDDDKSLTAYAVLGVEYYRVTSPKTGQKFEMILPRDLSSMRAEEMLQAKFFRVAGEPGYFSQSTITAIQRALKHPVRMKWVLVMFALLSALPIELMMATGMMFVLTYPASMSDRFSRKQLVRILQRRSRAVIVYGSTKAKLPMTNLRLARAKYSWEFYIVRLPEGKRRSGRIIDLVTPDSPVPWRTFWSVLRTIGLILSFGRLRAFGYVFLPEMTSTRNTVTHAQKKLSYL